MPAVELYTDRLKERRRQRFVARQALQQFEAARGFAVMRGIDRGHRRSPVRQRPGAGNRHPRQRTEPTALQWGQKPQRGRSGGDDGTVRRA